MKIAIIVGSLRRESFNAQLAKLAKNNAPQGVDMINVSLTDLPFFNQELEAEVPESVINFKQQISNSDGVLIITPEYNRSIPGILKNAIDWASRPDKGSVWSNKPVGIMGASTGQFGTITAQFDLRRVLTHTGALVMPQPQALVTKVEEKLESGEFDPSTTKFVGRYLEALASWINRSS